MSVDVTESTQTTRQAPYIEDYQRKLFDLSQSLGQIPQTLPTQQIQGLSQLQQDAIQTGRGIGAYQSGIDTAYGTAGQGLQALVQGARGSGTGFTGGMGAMRSAISGLQGSPTGQGYLGQAAGAYGQAGGQYGAAGFAPGQGFSAESFDPSSVSKYMNPYEDMAVQQALKDIRREGDIAQTAQQAAGVQAGAFGGSRQGLQSAELAGNIFREQGRTAAGMRQAGFQNAMQQAMQESQFGRGQAQQESQFGRGQAQQESQFGRQLGSQAFEQARQRQLAMGQGLAGLGAQQGAMAAQRAQTLGQLGTGYAGIGAAQAQEAARLGLGIGQLGTTQANIAGMGQNMLGQQAQLQSQLGAMQQAQTQRELDARYQNQMRQLYEPYQRMGFMADILKPSIGSAQMALTSQTAPSPSIWSQLIGGGIAGLGAYKALTGQGGLFGKG